MGLYNSMLRCYSISHVHLGGIITVKKLELLQQIEKLSAIVHGEDLPHLFSVDTIKEISFKLDQLSEEYIKRYCSRIA